MKGIPMPAKTKPAQPKKPGKKVMPKIVSAAEWQKTHQVLLEKEKAATKAQDALAAERRRQPMTRIDKPYVFEGPAGNTNGRASLLDLFEGRSQLLLYHFMFAAGVNGWPKAGCPGCSFFLDQICSPVHLNARDVSVAVVSRAPLANIQAYRKRMGWTLPWYSSAGSEFNADFGLTTPEGENHGLSVFLRDGKDIYRTYFSTARGLELLGSTWSFLDIMPYGRQETWEVSPPGWPQTPPFTWWRRHDEYGQSNPAKSK
jgi:predicted dithiol-disulfide oxidoreductase (DUF899 family)